MVLLRGTKQANPHEVYASKVLLLTLFSVLLDNTGCIKDAHKLRAD